MPGYLLIIFKYISHDFLKHHINIFKNFKHFVKTQISQSSSASYFTSCLNRPQSHQNKIYLFKLSNYLYNVLCPVPWLFKNLVLLCKYKMWTNRASSWEQIDYEAKQVWTNTLVSEFPLW